MEGLKIDRSLTGRLPDSKALLILQSVSRMAAELSLSVVSQGIETEVQESTLRDLGFDLVQGWRYAPAVAPSALLDFLPAETRPPRALR